MEPECPDDNSSDKTPSFESDVHLPAKNSERDGLGGVGQVGSGGGGRGRDVAGNETCCECLEPRGSAPRLMDGRRSCANFRRTQARCLFTGSCESSAIYPRRKLQSELLPETKCALKGDELREGNWRRRAPVLRGAY